MTKLIGARRVRLTGLVLVAAVLAWRALTLWALKGSFVGGALALFITTMLSLAVLSPDAYIATQNVKRESVDVAYLFTLSDDALPALAQARDRLPNPPNDTIAYVLEYRANRLGASESPLTWNLGRARTRAALRGFRTR